MSEERMSYHLEDRAGIRRETRLPFADADYSEPTKDEFRRVMQVTGLSASEVAKLCGLSDGRTVRRYVGGDRAVPYSVWRLLLLHAGLALDGDGVALDTPGGSRKVTEKA